MSACGWVAWDIAQVHGCEGMCVVVVVVVVVVGGGGGGVCVCVWCVTSGLSLRISSLGGW